MKIERINENQIRCTLTSADLASRQIDLGELAYGSEKAKRLFNDMMTQAHSKFGFESGNSPLMIEAIPVSHDSIVLVITKVDDPEELDTRFSRFTQSQDGGRGSEARQFTGADSILDLFKTIAEAKAKTAEPPADCPMKKRAAEPAAEKKSVNLVQAFAFSSLDDMIAAARGLGGCYSGRNSLYKLRDGSYRLVVHQSDCTPEKFNKVCNILSEYGTGLPFSPAAEAFLTEHGDAVIREGAVQSLTAL